MSSYSRDLPQIEFCEMCMLGDAQRVRSALATGIINVNYQHWNNKWSSLHWAASRGHQEICLLLIEAGVPLNLKDNKGKYPYDVCPADHTELREILKPGIPEEEKDDEEEGGTSEEMVEDDHRSTASSTSPKFVPNYIRHPPFPYSSRSSFDNYSTPASPASPGPAVSSSTYSYGRRDSAETTRFLLVRTSVAQGKETYKRVTLPGGMNLEKVKLTIEKAFRIPVEMIFTLPDNILVETVEQIRAFKHSQKVDVIFKDQESMSVSWFRARLSRVDVSDLVGTRESTRCLHGPGLL
ncbi:unnamed protein product [Caenorhabditis bovis]|uniref:ANK_REP_REGION domain-containing protein n=1 Tax=Caenorhabditis bovis TaxID=2654633 RepID=A0A8S1EGE1_9PELO|nr:unnamed protein product [Caenorhabditis bovis]